MRLEAGSVIKIYDGRTRPKKVKWHVCVVPSRRWFFRINSSPLWKPHHPISAADNPFLEHDSFVELAQPHFFTESELRGCQRLGVMSAAECAKLAIAAKKASTLTEEQSDLVWQFLKAFK